jgi:hypothetical protein
MVLPQIFQSIHDKVTGDLGCAQTQKQVSILGQQEPKGCHGGVRLEIMVRRSYLYPVVAFARSFPDLNNGFRIQRDPQCIRARIRLPVYPIYFFENCVGFRYFFWACFWLLCADEIQIHSFSCSPCGGWEHPSHCTPSSQLIDAALLPHSSVFTAVLS